MIMMRRLPDGRQPLNTALAQTGLTVVARQGRIDRCLFRESLFHAPAGDVARAASRDRAAVRLLAQWATIWLLRHLQ
jgi:hypothetical protein